MKFKSLHKLAMVAVMALLGGIVASAQTQTMYTITIPKVTKWTQGQSLDGESYTASKIVTVSFSKGDGTETPTYNLPSSASTTENYAILAVGNTMTLSAPQQYIMTKVEIAFDKEGAAVNDNYQFTPTGTYTTGVKGEKTNYVWKGVAQNLILKNLSNEKGLQVGRIYVTCEAAPFTIASASDNIGFYKVSAGTLTNDNKFIIEEANVAALDMTDVKLDENVTSLNLSNPNTILKVAGTISNSTGIPSEDDNWGKLDGVNMVVTNGKAYAAVSTINFVDIDGCSVLTKRHFTAKNDCFYTRTIKAGAWATSVLPAAAKDLPFDAYVVDTDNSTENNVVFKKVTEVDAYTPFLIHNVSGDNVDWKVSIRNEKNNAVDMRGTNESNTIKTISTPPSNMTGTFDIIPCDGSQYALTSSTTAEDNVLKLKKFGGNAKIGAFRAYFTLNDATTPSAVNFSFIGGNPTDVEGLKEVLGVQHPANIYNLNGQVVKTGATTLDGLDKGIYLFNGKKYVVK